MSIVAKYTFRLYAINTWKKRAEKLNSRPPSPKRAAGSMTGGAKLLVHCPSWAVLVFNLKFADVH
jgi:hypothetical protein